MSSGILAPTDEVGRRRFRFGGRQRKRLSRQNRMSGSAAVPLTALPFFRVVARQGLRLAGVRTHASPYSSIVCGSCVGAPLH